MPPDVLDRFVGQRHLYYTVVVFDTSDRANPRVQRWDEGTLPSVLVSGSFMGSGNRSIRINGGHNGDGAVSLTWAGDQPMPGEGVPVQPVAAPSPVSAPVEAQAMIYRDGLEDMYGELTPRMARAQMNQSFNLTWNDVQLIPQPTDMSCR